MLKKIYRVIISNLFLAVISLLFVAILTVSLFRPVYLKKWLASSDIYTSAVDGIIAQSLQSQTEQNVSNDGSPSLSDPEVQAAAKKALSPQLLQASVENMLGGTFNWLNGKTAKPDFNVDLTEAKSSFAIGVGEAIHKRYLALPVCAPKTAPTSTDPFNINCQPKVGFNIDTEIEKFVSEMKASKDFLPNTIITADSFYSDNNGVKKSFFDQNKAIPGYYQLIQKTPYILTAIGLFLMILLIFSAESRLIGVRRVGTTLLIWGIIYAITLVAGSYLVVKESDKLANRRADSAFLLATNDSLVKLIKAVNHDSTKTGLLITGSYALLGGSLFVGSTILQKKRPSQDKANSSNEISTKDKSEISYKDS